MEKGSIGFNETHCLRTEQQSIIRSRADTTPLRRKGFALIGFIAFSTATQRCCLVQIARKLGEAEEELSILLDGQQSGVASLQSKEKQKKWLKF